MSACQKITQENVESFIHSFDNILFDCDDVLWNAETPVKGASEAVAKLRKLGKQVLFVTNTNVKSREQLVDKFEVQGYKVSKEEIFSSGWAAAVYLKDIVKLEGKVYMVGTEGLHRELTQHGLDCVGLGPDPTVGEEMDWLDIELDKEVRAVVVGFDKDFSFMKMFKAASYLSDPDVIFIGTNTDENVPYPDKGKLRPGTGGMVRAIEVASLRPPTVMGKPSMYLFDAIQAKYSLDPSRTVMVGDRHNTDVLFGKRCGFKTLAVFTGILNDQMLASFQESTDPKVQDYIPDYTLNSVGDFVDLLD